MPEVVAKTYRLAKVLVQPQGASDNSRYLRYFKGMSKTRSVMRVVGRKKNLRLIHKATEGFRMYYSVAVTLEFRTVFTRNVRVFSSLCIFGQKSIF